LLDYFHDLLGRLSWSAVKLDLYGLKFFYTYVKHILSTENGRVTFRYKDSKTKRYKTRTLPGKDFIRLILQHVLPRRFRRSRDYGFLHPNSKGLIKLLHYLLKFKPSAWTVQMQPRAKIPYPCCGAAMQIMQTRIKRMMFISGTVSPAIAGGSH